MCDHPVYNFCTLYMIRNKGLAVIQQRYDAETKTTWWTDIDDWLIDMIYLHEKFKDYFDKYSREKDDKELYPTVTLRQIMCSLKMKPFKRERWETTFFHSDI